MESARALYSHDLTAFEEFWAAEEYLIENNTSHDNVQFNPMDGVRLEIFDFEGKQDSATELISAGQRELAYIRNFPNINMSIGAPFFSSSSTVSPPFIIDYKNYERIDSDKIYEEKRIAKLLSSIYSLYQEYSLPDWDGYDAQPIQKSACDEAVQFVKMLPSNIPLPEALPEPTGAVSFEWYKKSGHVFITSLSGDGIVEYAGLFGNDNKSYGSERIGNSIPDIILYHIHRLF